MKNIIIVSWNYSMNYGTMLQAYALDRYLKSLGNNCLEFCGRGRFFSRQNLYDVFHGVTHPIKVLIKKEKVILDKEIQEKLLIKEKRIETFCKDNFEYIKINSFFDLIKKVPAGSIFIAGSDQIWNPFFLHDTKLLYFVPHRYKKISYASSIGIKELPKKSVKHYRRLLNRFERISVREESAARELERILGKKIETVLDPTFFIKKEDWEDISYKADEIVKNSKNYIFTYFIGDNLNYQEQIKEISKILGLDVINLVSNESMINKYGKTNIESGVYEFIWLIKNAAYILTDSFHAVALSLNLEKNFLVFDRFGENMKNSQNSRIHELLYKVGLEDRIYSVERNVEMCITKEINFEDVKKLLSIELKKAERFLEECLE